MESAAVNIGLNLLSSVIFAAGQWWGGRVFGNSNFDAAVKQAIVLTSGEFPNCGVDRFLRYWVKTNSFEGLVESYKTERDTTRSEYNDASVIRSFVQVTNYVSSSTCPQPEEILRVFIAKLKTCILNSPDGLAYHEQLDEQRHIETLGEVRSLPTAVHQYSLSQHQQAFSTIDSLDKIISVFVAPSQYERARNILLDRHIVVLSGPPHVGKTATAIFLAQQIKREQELDNIVLIDDPNEDLRSWNTVANTVIVLDDCFGASSLQNNRTDDFNQTARRLSQSNFIICTTRQTIVQNARESTRLGEDSTFEQYNVELSPEESYDETSLWDILEKHLNWGLSENATHTERITDNQAELAREFQLSIVKNLRFPHNIERFCVAHLPYINNWSEVEGAIREAQEIERAVKAWARKLSDPEKWFVFSVALFPDVSIDTLRRVYLKTSQFLGFKPRNTSELMRDLSAYISIQESRRRPVLRHPSFQEAIVSLMREHYKNEVGETADAGLQEVLVHEPLSLAFCHNADLGWPRPNLSGIPEDTFFLNPYLEQFSVAYNSLRSGIFKSLALLLEPCTEGQATVLCIFVRNTLSFHVAVIPQLESGALCYVEEVEAEEADSRIQKTMMQAFDVGLPVRFELLDANGTSVRSPQMHALTLVRSQVRELFQHQRLYEAWPLIQLRTQSMLKKLPTQLYSYEPQIVTDWQRPLDNETLHRIQQQFLEYSEAPSPPPWPSDRWQSKVADKAMLVGGLVRAYQLLDEQGKPYQGAVFPQRDLFEGRAANPNFAISYSEERLKEALKQVIERLIEAYKWMAETNFTHICKHLPLYNLPSFKVVGAVTYSEHWPGGTATFYFLPQDFPTRDDEHIELHVEEQKDSTLQASNSFSPQMEERMNSVSPSSFYSFSTHPLSLLWEKNFIRQVYSWLEQDVNEALSWRERDGFGAVVGLTQFMDVMPLYDWPAL